MRWVFIIFLHLCTLWWRLSEIGWPRINVHASLMNQVSIWNIKNIVGAIYTIKCILPFTWIVWYVVIHLLWRLIVCIIWYSKFQPIKEFCPLFATRRRLHNMPLDPSLSGHGLQAVVAVEGGHGMVGQSPSCLCPIFHWLSPWHFAIYWTIRCLLRMNRWGSLSTLTDICFYFIFQTTAWPRRDVHSCRKPLLIATNKPYANSKYKWVLWFLPPILPTPPPRYLSQSCALSSNRMQASTNGLYHNADKENYRG